MQPISLVMLVYNEAGTIEKAVREYYGRVVEKVPGSEFIIAEDGSTDGTKEILLRLAKDIPLKLVQGKDRRGYAPAFRNALSLPRNDIIFLSDSGGKNDPSDFWKLYERIDAADMVIGLRSGRQDSWFRKILTWGYNQIVNFYFGSAFKDIDSGFRLVKKKAVQEVLKQRWIFPELISSEFTLRIWAKGFKIREFPVTYRSREGQSRGLPLKKIPGAIWQVISRFPILKKELWQKI